MKTHLTGLLIVLIMLLNGCDGRSVAIGFASVFVAMLGVLVVGGIWIGHGEGKEID